MKIKNTSAFTLIELLIVLSILAILATLAIMAFSGQILKGNDATRKSDINRIKIAVEEYEKDHNCYPITVVCTNGGKGLQPYLDKIPCDPITKASYFYDPQPGVCPSWFRFYSVLQNTSDPVVIPGIGPNYAFNYVSGSSNMPDSVSGVPLGTAGVQGGGGGNPMSKYYGCRSGSCVEIGWNSGRPGPECDPSFQDSSCYGQCGPAAVECVMWH